ENVPSVPGLPPATPSAARNARRLGAVGRAQFADRLGEIIAQRAFRQAEPPGDLGATVPFASVTQNLPLAVGQRVSVLKTGKTGGKPGGKTGDGKTGDRRNVFQFFHATKTGKRSVCPRFYSHPFCRAMRAA